MLANLCNALSHPVRLQILTVLAARSVCICREVIEINAFSETIILNHLRALQRAGFIQGNVDGPNRCYQLNADTLATFKRLVERL